MYMLHTHAHTYMHAHTQSFLFFLKTEREEKGGKRGEGQHTANGLQLAPAPEQIVHVLAGHSDPVALHSVAVR